MTFMNGNGSGRGLLIPVTLAIGIVGGAFTLGGMISANEAGGDALRERVARLDADVTEAEDRVSELEDRVSGLRLKVDRLQYRLDDNYGSER